MLPHLKDVATFVLTRFTSLSFPPFPNLLLAFFLTGYSVRIRESNTPGRKVGLWGCDYCSFTHANVAKVQEHVSEQHLSGLKRKWDASSWHGSESVSRDALCDEGSGLSLPPGRRFVATKPLDDSLMEFVDPEDDDDDYPPQPLVICRIDDEDSPPSAPFWNRGQLKSAICGGAGD